MIIISGATRGLGKAIYESLKPNYTNVIGLSKNGDNKLGIIKCDISNLSSVKSAANEIKKIDKKAYAFINAAGVASMNLALATPEEIKKKLLIQILLEQFLQAKYFHLF